MDHINCLAADKNAVHIFFRLPHEPEGIVHVCSSNDIPLEHRRHTERYELTPQGLPSNLRDLTPLGIKVFLTEKEIENLLEKSFPGGDFFGNPSLP